MEEQKPQLVRQRIVGCRRHCRRRCRRQHHDTSGFFEKPGEKGGTRQMVARMRRVAKHFHHLAQPSRKLKEKFQSRTDRHRDIQQNHQTVQATIKHYGMYMVYGIVV